MLHANEQHYDLVNGLAALKFCTMMKFQPGIIIIAFRKIEHKYDLIKDWKTIVIVMTF
jgi:hypothetical protein